MTSEPVRDVFDAGGRGLQHHGLRRANERAVLTVIAFNAGVSNADIARLSGLAPQTVSAILTDLEQAGLTAKGEVLRGRRGQPATPIFLRADGAFAIGVEIGWRHVEVVLVDLHAQVLERQHRDHVFPDASTLPADIATMIGAMLAPLPDAQRARLRDIGVAMPTNIAGNLHLVDAPETQRILWDKLDVADELARLTGLAVTLSNDGNAACWAELIASPRPRPADFIYFLISRYIAAGIVGQGTLWEGPSGNSANLGSMLVSDGDGRLQAAHFVASLTALEQRLTAAGFAVDATQIDRWDWAGFGDVLDQWIADSAKALARVVFNTTTVIESGLVVLDGVLPAPIIARLVTQLEAELQRLPIAPYVPPQVLPGHLGALAPAMGAAQLTLYRRHFSRTLADLAG
ncbi:ROK family transcriptional regulator [Devosia sp.]|uniref:ROK family transcriptional regulator n=1 Tax=Devosia sp. TaxID=1871048 RepID=UPI002FC5DEC5